MLWFATFGMYSLYWFWRHWKLHKLDKKLDIWPVPRAIFAIFFAHSLNSEIDYRIQRERLQHRWSPAGWATLFVIAILGGRLILRFLELALSPLETLAILVAMQLCGAAFAYHSQRAANIACGDPDARANRHLTILNGVWLLLGAAFWLLLSLGVLITEGSPQ